MSVDGIAGSTLPEVEGVFLAESFWDGFWYASFGRHSSVDIWNVRADGLALREDNEGWICSSVIPPDRLTLVETDLSPETADAWLDAQTPSWLKTDGEAEPETEPQSGFAGYISGDQPPTP